MWPRVFINYRREDSPGSAGRLYDHLAEEIPAEHLFMDVDAIAPGVDFVNEIEQAVKSCDVLLVIIGRSWLTAVDRQGKRRLDDPDDFVRLEIATALKHDVRLIPVLVDGATMPAVGDIPRDIQALVRRNAVEISHQRFATDSRHLAHALLAGEAAPKPGHERGLAPAAAARPLVVPSGGIPHAPVPMWRALAVSGYGSRPSRPAIGSCRSTRSLRSGSFSTSWWGRGLRQSSGCLSCRSCNSSGFSARPSPR
jgi:hypothetical protein